MALALKAVVDGRPLPLKRARTGNGRHYDPPENVAHKERIQWAIRWNKPLLLGPLRVVILCEFRQAKPTADVDNLGKMVLDGLNGYVWKDDVQVMDLHVVKAGSAAVDRTVIIVETIEETE